MPKSPFAEPSGKNADGSHDQTPRLVWYAVFYHKNGTITMWPGETKEEARAALEEALSDERVFFRCLRTTIVSRTVKPSADDGRPYPFGRPAAHNVLPRFAKDIRSGKRTFRDPNGPGKEKNE